MRSVWSVFLAGALLLLVLGSVPVDGASASIEMDEDQFYISVDPSDEDIGFLEISGTIEGGLQNLRDQITVTLSVNITEEYYGDPTGKYWACNAEFDDETVTPEETRLTYNQDSADFTITITPELADGLSGDIAVPPGISPLMEGKLELKMSYTGSSEGDDIERATITPDYFHLINLSTPVTPIEVKAGNKLNYTLRVKNAGNEIDTVNIDIPILEELEDDGWTTSLSISRIVDMEPGQEEKAVLLLEAPDEIMFDKDVELKMSVATEILDPYTQEPASSDELTIILELKRSKVSDPIIPDDDDDDEENITGTDPNTSPYAVIGVISGMAVIAVVVIILLFVKAGGGGDEEENDDMHTSMVRI